MQWGRIGVGYNKTVYVTFPKEFPHAMLTGFISESQKNAHGGVNNGSSIYNFSKKGCNIWRFDSTGPTVEWLAIGY